MSFHPRRALRAGLVLLTLGCGAAFAQAWPAKPIKLVVPATPGGSADPLARLVAEELGRAVGQGVVVENRPGANGNVGAQAAAKSPPDGHTLLLGWTGTMISAVTLYDAKPFHPQRDFEAIVLVGAVPNVIVVQPALGINSLQELTAYAKKNPAKLNFGSIGSGSSYHLSGELYKKTVGVFMVHVPYTSPAAMFTDLIGNRLQFAFPGAPAAAPFVKDARLKALAVMADRPSSALPGVPTTRDLGMPMLSSETWFGLLAPKGTPAEIQSRINEAINAALGQAAFRDKLEAMGYTPLGGKPERFTAAIRDDLVKWGEVVKFSGAKVD